LERFVGNIDKMAYYFLYGILFLRICTRLIEIQKKYNENGFK